MAEVPWRKTLNGQRARLLTRGGVLAAGILFSLPLVSWAWAPLVLPAMSPFLTLVSAAASRALGIGELMGIPFVLIAMLRRRWFCRWACPVGLILEGLARMRSSGGTGVERLPPIGQWIVFLTLGGALAGYPILLWMDPLALFSGALEVVRLPRNGTAWISAIGLCGVLVLSVIWPTVWTRRICPLGAMQDVLSRLPRRWIGRTSGQTEENGARLLARRSLLAGGLGAAWAATISWGRAQTTSPLRPPGAIEEERFTGLCVRCGNCVRACPTRILRPDVGQYGIAGFLAPTVEFRKNYCREDCCRCTQVCPSGALSRLTLEQKRKRPIGLARVNMEHCLLSEGKECDICASRCPYEAIRIVFDEGTYASFPLVDRKKCPGCGACELACPTEPKAIGIYPFPARRG